MSGTLLWLLLLSAGSSSSSCFGSQLDIRCLKTVKQSVVDPNGILKSSWNFDNTTDGFICRFTGVECWDSTENKVSALRLSSLGLGGQFPRGLEYCTSLDVLDLSNNNFSGPIPSNITRQVTYLTSLDLSYNSFSGEIPVGIGNMALHFLYIQHNQLSGQIPREFDGLLRLTTLNVQTTGYLGLFLCLYPSSRHQTLLVTKGSVVHRWMTVAIEQQFDYKGDRTRSTRSPVLERLLGSSWGSWYPSLPSLLRLLPEAPCVHLPHILIEKICSMPSELVTFCVGALEN
jgi:hypothetical protein